MFVWSAIKKAKMSAAAVQGFGLEDSATATIGKVVETNLVKDILFFNIYYKFIVNENIGFLLLKIYLII